VPPESYEAKPVINAYEPAAVGKVGAPPAKRHSEPHDIDELASVGLLSKKQADFLHSHRFMGNEAAHEIVSPKPEHLIAALDIAETLLKTIYILPEMAEQINKKKKKKP